MTVALMAIAPMIVLLLALSALFSAAETAMTGAMAIRATVMGERLP